MIPRKASTSYWRRLDANATDWSEEEIELIDGWEDLGEGRLQGNLF